MQNFRTKLMAAVAALCCSGAFAQTAPSSPAAPAPAPAPAAAQQAGVVYPGQPVQPTATAQRNPTVASMPVPGGYGQPGAPGTVMGQVPPMPALGATGPAQLTPSQQYLEDNMPAELPKTIRDFKHRLDESQRAAAEYVRRAPKPTSGSITITQAPSEASPTLRLTVGVVSNVVFSDSTGAPWPIEFATPGDTGVVDVLVPVAGSSTVQIRPKSAYTYGAVSINLKGNPVPVTLILATAQNEFDTRLDVRVARRGPNAVAPVIDRPSFTAADEVMLSVLDGVPPKEAKTLTTSNSGLRAWSFNNRLYVRTSVPVVSPAWSDSASSVDGTRAYVLPLVPMVTVSIDGSLQVVRVGD